MRAVLRALGGAGEIQAAAIELSGEGDSHSARLELTALEDGTIAASGELVIDEVRPWWPHTHGEPSLYDARLLVDAGEQHRLDAGTVGFRALESRGELERDGVALAVNGVPVFARGAVWTPLDPALPCSRGGELERALGMVAAAGMNMLRVPGIGCYESDEFYELCDRLGILVWQDFMFANLDYPESDEQFMEGVRREATEVLGSACKAPEPRGAVRRQRGGPAGRDARTGPAARKRPAVRRAVAVAGRRRPVSTRRTYRRRRGAAISRSAPEPASPTTTEWAPTSAR